MKFYLIKLAADFYSHPSYLLLERASLKYNFQLKKMRMGCLPDLSQTVFFFANFSCCQGVARFEPSNSGLFMKGSTNVHLPVLTFFTLTREH
jgi:hypothetical protein